MPRDCLGIVLIAGMLGASLFDTASRYSQAVAKGLRVLSKNTQGSQGRRCRAAHDWAEAGGGGSDAQSCQQSCEDVRNLVDASKRLGRALTDMSVLRALLFPVRPPMGLCDWRLVARGYAPVMAARRPCGCQQNAVQNVLVRHTLPLAPPLYASRLRDRRDRPWIAL